MVQLLKGFHRTAVLAPGQSETVTFAVDTQSLSVFDVVSDSWIVVPGIYTLRVGSSSRDIRGSVEVKV